MGKRKKRRNTSRAHLDESRAHLDECASDERVVGEWWESVIRECHGMWERSTSASVRLVWAVCGPCVGRVWAVCGPCVGRVWDLCARLVLDLCKTCLLDLFARLVLSTCLLDSFSRLACSDKCLSSSRRSEISSAWSLSNASLMRSGLGIEMCISWSFSTKRSFSTLLNLSCLSSMSSFISSCAESTQTRVGWCVSRVSP